MDVLRDYLMTYDLFLVLLLLYESKTDIARIQANLPLKNIFLTKLILQITKNYIIHYIYYMACNI